jgi:sugar phosphate isomerase/epimerase
MRPQEDYEFVRDCAVHYHIKDVASDDSGWYFTEIGKGTIGYQNILKNWLPYRCRYRLKSP